MDCLGSWRSVFLSNRIMEISCQIVSWIALCLGGWSFCWIESCRFALLIAFCLLGWSGHWSFFVMLLQYTYLFLGVVLFVRVWRDFLQRPIELGRCGLDVLCGGPQCSPFCLISWIFRRIGSWESVVGSCVGSCIFLLSVLLLDRMIAIHLSDRLPDRFKYWMIH